MRQCTSFFLLLACLLSPTDGLEAQALRFDHISLEEGLSDLTVFSAAQDAQGFLWFGTADGLNKYDGHTFTVFRSNPADSTSMPPGTIGGLCVDRSGTLWIAASSGLAILPPDSTRPRRVQNVAVYGKPEPHTVVWVDTLRNGDVGVATDVGFYLFEPAARKFTELVFDTAKGIGVSAFCEARDGTLWFGTYRHGLVAYDRTTQMRRSFMAYRVDTRVMLDNGINRIKEDRHGTLWVAANDGLYRMDSSGTSFERLTQKHGLAIDLIMDILEDRSGAVWVGTFHLGVARYRRESDDFVRYTYDPEDPESINSERLTRLFEDRGGVLWFATYRAGLNRYNAKRSSFTRFTTKKTPGAGLSSEGVYAILEDSVGDVWLGTYGGGLNRYDHRTGRYSHYHHQPGNRNTLASDNILSLLEWPKGYLWVGGSQGLDRMEISSGRTVHYPMVDEKNRLGQSREVKCLLRGSDGYLWFGTFVGGLHRLNPKTGETRFYKYLGLDSTSGALPGIWTMCEDVQGRLWMGSYGGGLFVMDKQTETFKRYVSDAAQPVTSLSNNGVYCILRDRNAVFWIGTMGGGLNRFDPERETFTNYTVENGLPNNFVKGIQEDARGELWLSTDFGISRFNPRASTFRNLTSLDGLMGNVFLSGAHTKGAGGRMYFGGEKGAVSFHPDSVMENGYVPPVVITSMSVLGQPYPLYGTRRFSYGQNSVAFEFVALDYTLPERNCYAYRLDGVDHDWVNAGTRRYANFLHLDPGTYTFKVKGSNNDGVWNEAGTSLSFTITPPFWQMAWFEIAAIAVLIGLGTLLYNYRVHRLLEIERLRVRIASDLHDDIGSSLTRISLQSELIQEGIDPQEVGRYLKNIASMSRELVSTMSDIVWSIDARNDLMENLITKIRDFASTTLSTKQIELAFAHSGLDLQKKISVDKRENIYLFCKEAVNNIAKHSGAANARIVIRNDHDKATVVIEDDGRGMGSAMKLNSHGLKNMRLRAQRLGGSVEILNHNGTRVILTVGRL